MTSLRSLVESIPDGRKREYLGRLFVNSLTEFYNNFEKDNVDLDDLIVRNIDIVILKDDFIRDLKLFSQNNLNLIFDEERALNCVNVKDIRGHLMSYYDIQSVNDVNIGFAVENTTVCDVPLHPFQERIRRFVINLIFNNKKRFLVHMPTGSGKTRTAAEILLDFIRLSSSKALLNDKIKILWIAQSSELCQQAADTVKFIIDKKGTQNLRLGHFYDEGTISSNIADESAIIFCTIQKLLLHYTDDIWQKIKNETYLVIVDEAHRSVASKWVKALDFFVDNPSVYLLGLTATPGLRSGNDDSNYLLSTYYSSLKISITDDSFVNIASPIKYLTDLGFLARIERIDIDSNVQINESGYTIEDHEYKFKSQTLEELTSSPSRNLSIVNIIRENHILGKKMLVFTCGVEHNKILQTILLGYHIESGVIDANSKNRRILIDRFKDGDLNVLLNYGVLTTGFDAPRTDICIIARPITSVVMYSQMVGRILRGTENKGNYENVLYTIKDNFGHGDYDQLFKSFDEFYI